MSPAENNRLGIIRAIVPSILITLCIGSVYAFSFFAKDISEYIGSNLGNVQFAFSLSIFFLGMGAAFFGPMVEKNIRASSLLSTSLFVSGMCLTTIGIHLRLLWMVFLGYGVFNGLAQGIGYISPVKNLMLWYPNRKGLASAISIVSFGLGSSLCVMLSKAFLPVVGIQWIFLVLGAIYLAMMLVGSLLLKKPNVYDRLGSNIGFKFSYGGIFKDLNFWQCWLFMLLNISAGLALIGASKNIFSEIVSNETTIVLLLMLCGLFNGGFRLVFAWISDYLGRRVDIWLVIALLSVIFIGASSIHYPLIVLAILLLNATYGGGFSTCPSILSDLYGNTAISRIHGLVLSAWGIAAIPAYFLNSYVFKHMDSFRMVPAILLMVYLANLVNVFLLRRKVN